MFGWVLPILDHFTHCSPQILLLSVKGPWLSMVNTQLPVKKSLTKPDGFQKIWMFFHAAVMAPKQNKKTCLWPVVQALSKKSSQLQASWISYTPKTQCMVHLPTFIYHKNKPTADEYGKYTNHWVSGIERKQPQHCRKYAFGDKHWVAPTWSQSSDCSASSLSKDHSRLTLRPNCSGRSFPPKTKFWVPPNFPSKIFEKENLAIELCVEIENSW